MLASSLCGRVFMNLRSAPLVEEMASTRSPYENCHRHQDYEALLALDQTNAGTCRDKAHRDSEEVVTVELWLRVRHRFSLLALRRLEHALAPVAPAGGSARLAQLVVQKREPRLGEPEEDQPQDRAGVFEPPTYWPQTESDGFAEPLI